MTAFLSHSTAMTFGLVVLALMVALVTAQI